MRKIISWWVEVVVSVQTLIIGITAAWYAGKYYPNWIVEYQLAFVMSCIIVAAIILIVIIKIIYRNRGDFFRHQYDIKNIHSQYRKRK